jgi:hypothetical protein
MQAYEQLSTNVVYTSTVTHIIFTLKCRSDSSIAENTETFSICHNIVGQSRCAQLCVLSKL